MRNLRAAGTAPRSFARSAAHLGGLTMGEAVELHGLVRLGDLNGRVGHALRWSDAEQRYHVSVRGDERLFAVRPQHWRLFLPFLFCHGRAM